MPKSLVHSLFRAKNLGECPVDIAMPCATENEVNIEDAKMLVSNGCFLVAETSNMGCTAEAVEYLTEAITYAPGKAVNAGGVAVSGLEMSQNSIRMNWPKEEVDMYLHRIMKRHSRYLREIRQKRK